jgi:hypothetical protein
MNRLNRWAPSSRLNPCADGLSVKRACWRARLPYRRRRTSKFRSARCLFVQSVWRAREQDQYQSKPIACGCLTKSTETLQKQVSCFDATRRLKDYSPRGRSQAGPSRTTLTRHACADVQLEASSVKRQLQSSSAAPRASAAAGSLKLEASIHHCPPSSLCPFVSYGLRN